jgi:hypothetical protein
MVYVDALVTLPAGTPGNTPVVIKVTIINNNSPKPTATNPQVTQVNRFASNIMLGNTSVLSGVPPGFSGDSAMIVYRITLGTGTPVENYGPNNTYK